MYLHKYGGLRVDISMMVMCDASATVEYGRRRSLLSNAPLNTD